MTRRSQSQPSNTQCWRRIDGTWCGALKTEHVDGRCPRDQSREYRAHTTVASSERVSTSFRREELAWLSQLLTLASRHPDFSVLMRNPSAARMVAKSARMRGK